MKSLTRRLAVALVSLSTLVALPASAQPANTATCFSGIQDRTYSEVIDEAFASLGSNDLSTQVLAAVFGSSYYSLSTSNPANNGAVVMTDGAVTSGTLERPLEFDAPANLGSLGIHNSGLFGILSLFLNAIGMLLALWIVLVGAGQGLINSGTEGVVLGKQYSAVWWPIRIGQGLLFLVPFFDGYSLLQQGAMVIGRLAVAFSNMMYQVVLAFVAWFGGGLIEPPARDVTPVFAQMVEAELCSAFAAESGDTPIINDSGQAVFSSRSGARGARTSDLAQVGRYSVDYNVRGQVEESDQACGSIVLNIPGEYYDGLAPQAKQSTVSAYNTFWSTVNSVRQGEAQQIAAAIVAGQPINISTWRAGSAKIQDGLDTLTSTMAQNAVMSGVAGEDRTRVCTALTELQDLGWLSFGGVYWNISNIGAENYRRIQAVGESFVVRSPKTSSTAAAMEQPITGAPWRRRGAIDDYQKVRARFETAMREVGAESRRTTDWAEAGSDLRDTVSLTAGGVPQTQAGSGWQMINQAFGMRTAVDYVTKKVTQDGDVIANLADAGNILVGTASVMWTAVVAAQALKGVQEGTGFWGFLSKSAVPVASGVVGGLSGIAPYVMTFIILPLLVLGLYMAFYLPAIPILYWFSGVTTWVISHFLVVMSMPILAASMFAPQGNGFSSDQSRNGFMNILNLGLRAPLMVVGFAGGMAIMQVMGIVIGAIYPLAFRSASMSSMFGFISFFAALVVLYVIVLATANRIYALVSDMGDEIMEFFGGGRRQLGDERINQQGSSTLAGAFVQRPEGMLKEGAMRAGRPSPAAAQGQQGRNPNPAASGSTNASSLNQS